METTPAIVLRKTRLTETSLIITWLTEQHGKMKTVAKGALRNRSAFAGKLDLFFDCEIGLARSRRSELHTLREVTLRETFEGLRLQLPRTELAAYFVELVELATEPESAVPEIYDLLKRAFAYLDRGEPTRKALLHFEAELSRVAGVKPESAEANAAANALARLFGSLPIARSGLLRKLR